MADAVSISLWFDNNAEQAMRFYAAVFPESAVSSVNPVVVDAQLCGVHFVGINGGPAFKINPSVSMMVICERKEEIDTIWDKLLDGGNVLMALNNYPWSDHYGWVQDKNGVTWQLYLGKLADVNDQKIVPVMMFSQAQQGKCREALHFYQTVFKDFRLNGVTDYPEGDTRGQVMHAQFIINHFTMMAMDSGVPQSFTFNEGVSFVLHCNDQEAIDYYWAALTGNGGTESSCGWCKDPYGVSWQVVPGNIGQLLKSESAAKALLKMKKIIISELV